VSFELVDGQPRVVVLAEFNRTDFDDMFIGAYVIDPPSDWDRLSEDQRRGS
jgi:hypothetical protein